jgi:hypothetical protein
MIPCASAKSLLALVCKKQFPMKQNPGLPAILVLILFSCAPSKKPENIVQDSLSASGNPMSNSPVDTSLLSTSVVEVDTTDFQSFMRLFESPGTEIPVDVISPFIETSEGQYTTKEMLMRDSFYLVLFNHFYPVGPGVDELHVASFSKGGQLIEQQLLGSSYPSSGPDGGGENYDYQYDVESKILSVTNSTIEWDEEAQQEKTNEKLRYFQVDNDGSLVNPLEYPEASDRLLTKDELSKYTKDQLLIMRNEVFAALGYTFKNQALKSYFIAKPWYSPQFDNVDERLSDIEKANVKLIKSVEDSK